jgi:Ca-activated chloride channel family protein
MNAFRFHDPLWLLLLVPVVALGVAALRRRRRVAVLYSDTSLLRELPTTLALRVKRLLPWLRLAGLALVVASLARPQQGLEEFRLRTEGVAIQMCIDHSGSMQAMDFELNGRQVNRLTAVKQVFRDFVTGKDQLAGRPDDQIGLVEFGGYADSKCPLTLDHGVLLQILDTVKIPEPVLNANGEPINHRLYEEDMSTALGDAVVLAVDRLKDVRAKSKVVILLSDGKQTAGVIEPPEAAKTAKTYGIKVYTIGVGSTGMAAIPSFDFFGQTVLQPQAVELDEATLKMLAEETGGRYFHAQDIETLKNVYAEIDRLEKTRSEGRLYTEYRELYPYALFPGLGLILLEIVLAATRFRSLP